MFKTFDLRKIKQRVMHTFGIESTKIGNLLVPNELMPWQSSAAFTDKVGTVYLSSDGDPLWFTMRKDPTNLIPTVYTLWKKYDLLPRVSTSVAITPDLVVGSLDLVISGSELAQISSSIASSPQLVSIVQRTAGSTSTCGPPLAVGWLAAELNTSKAGLNSKAVRVLHTWKDNMFCMGRKADLPNELNVKADNDSSKMGGYASNLFLAPKSSAPPFVQKISPSTSRFSEREEVSDILHAAVLQAIVTTIKSLTSSFPMFASSFYSAYILPFRPALVGKPNKQDASSPYRQININHSSHKSLRAFFNALDKQGILRVKDMRPEPLVLGVSTTHPDVVAHQPYTSLRDLQTKERKRGRRVEEEKSKMLGMVVKELWKPQAANGSVKIFTQGGFDSSTLYSYSDLGQAVDKYVDAQRLANPQDPSTVNVGRNQVLFSMVCAEGETIEDIGFLRREDVVRRLSDRMQRWYKMQSEGKDPVLQEGPLNPISIMVKTQQHRVSTLVRGFEPFLLGGEELANKLKRLCACATSVSLVPGSISEREVLVHGKHAKTVTEFLLSAGVPKEWIKYAGSKDKRDYHGNSKSVLLSWQERERVRRKWQQAAIRKRVGLGPPTCDFVQQRLKNRAPRRATRRIRRRGKN